MTRVKSFAMIDLCQILACAFLTEETSYDNKTIHIWSNHLLGVTGHDTLTRHEVLLPEDSRRYLEWYIWSVHITAFKERVTSTTYKKHITWEVWINHNIKLLAQ